MLDSFQIIPKLTGRSDGATGGQKLYLMCYICESMSIGSYLTNNVSFIPLKLLKQLLETNSFNLSFLAALRLHDHMYCFLADFPPDLRVESTTGRSSHFLSQFLKINEEMVCWIWKNTFHRAHRLTVQGMNTLSITLWITITVFILSKFVSADQWVFNLRTSLDFGP